MWVVGNEPKGREVMVQLDLFSYAGIRERLF